MQKKIVTISRQYGSGGRYIGKKLSEKLGIPCYDEKLIDMVAKRADLHRILWRRKVRE